jgi:DNA polymerase-3 subunit delta'
MNGLHPDVVTYAPDGTQIVMEQAQEIVALGQRRPHEGRARVIVLDEADRLNVSAANCLLKTLEEPSPGTHLVLVTAIPDRLLGTIRSRTQRVRFRALTIAALLDLGERRAINRADAQIAAIVADGSVTRFLDVATNTEDRGARDGAAGLRQAARARGIGPILDAASDLGDKESKDRLPDALTLLARIYRDALVTRAGAPELAVLTADGAMSDAGTSPDAGADAGRAFEPPTELGLPAIGRALAAIVEANAALAGNVNAVMAIERLLLSLRREERPTP